MLILRGPDAASRMGDPELRSLIQERFLQVLAGEPYDYDRHGYMIVVEPGDSVESVEAESGCPILTDVFGELHFGQPEFSPSSEVLEEHPCCYEMLFILNDEGFAVTIWVPKVDGIDPTLLSLCATFAVPAAEVVVS